MMAIKSKMRHQRELSGGKFMDAQSQWTGLDASRLVLRGCALVDPDQVLFDAGYKSPAAVVYLQLRKTGGASADGGGWDFGGHAP